MYQNLELHTRPHFALPTSAGTISSELEQLGNEHQVLGGTPLDNVPPGTTALGVPLGTTAHVWRHFGKFMCRGIVLSCPYSGLQDAHWYPGCTITSAMQFELT